MKGVPKKTAAGNWPDLVHYVRSPGECRPAIVTAEFTDEPRLYCNLMVVQDGENDTTGEVLDWKTSVYRTTDGEPHTWHAAHQCAEVTATYRAAHPTPTPPEEAPQASSSGDSAGGAEVPTQPDGSASPVSSGTQGASDSPSGPPADSGDSAGGEAPVAPDPIHQDPDLFAATHGGWVPASGAVTVITSTPPTGYTAPPTGYTADPTATVGPPTGYTAPPTGDPTPEGGAGQ